MTVLKFLFCLSFSLFLSVTVYVSHSLSLSLSIALSVSARDGSTHVAKCGCECVWVSAHSTINIKSVGNLVREVPG